MILKILELSSQIIPISRISSQIFGEILSNNFLSHSKIGKVALQILQVFNSRIFSQDFSEMNSYTFLSIIG